MVSRWMCRSRFPPIRRVTNDAAPTGLQGELVSGIESLRAELTRRVDALELAVQNAAKIRELRKDITDMRADIRRDTEEIRSIREVLERKADPEALLNLKARVQVLERRLGIQ